MDIDKIMQSSRPADEVNTYIVYFAVSIADGETTEGEDEWISDQMTVAGGPDAQAAIDAVRAHVTNFDKWGWAVKEFRLKGVKLLATADLSLL